MNMKTTWIIVGIIIVLGVLLIWSASIQEKVTTYWNNTNIACLAGGHKNLATHIHPGLVIEVDGIQETIPANIGINAGCMAEVHTHDETGLIHVETLTTERLKEIKFLDFFTVWGRDIVREGYNLTITVNNVEVADPTTIPLRDLDRIKLSYTSKE